MEFIIEVDAKDNEIGKIEKLEAHQKGVLHRAFSVFIFNSNNELLLQKRASSKYHSEGLWTNTCCSHPNFGEKTADAIERKLQQEMGLFCETTFKFHFTYHTQFENGLIENEFDHVYFGFTDQKPQPNPEEVEDYKYVSLTDLKKDIHEFPDKYTKWFQICLPKVIEFWQNR